jgi:hypothetical protein
MGGFALDPRGSTHNFFPGPRVSTSISQPSEQIPGSAHPLKIPIFRRLKTAWNRLVKGKDVNKPISNVDQYEQLTLTWDGMCLLAKYCPEAIPDIPVDQINDQSKANGLAKVFVCLQALWFCFQCITRLSFHLSISLLELNTFGHSICALMLAVLWWRKPLDVAEPTLIPIRGNKEYQEKMEPLCAFMCMASKLDGKREFDLFEIEGDPSKIQIPYKNPISMNGTAGRMRDLEEIIEPAPSQSGGGATCSTESAITTVNETCLSPPHR